MNRFLVSLSLWLAIVSSEAAAQATNFGFSPVGATQTLSATSSNSSVTLNSSPGDTILLQNTGAAAAYVRCGPTAATTSDTPIQPGFAIALNCSPNSKINAITASGSTTLQVTKGLGNFAMAGGGAGGTVTSPSLIDCSASNNILCGLIGAATPPGTNSIGNVGPLPYPLGATPITASATGTTGATTATLAGTSGKTTYICGYSIRANATAATTVTNTITGVITATLSSIMWVAPAASGIGIDEQIFSPCIPASASNTGIAVVSGAPGAGGNVSSKGWGYQL